MPRPPRVFTLVTVDDKHDPVYETYRDRAELEERLSSIEPDDPRYLLVEGEVVPFSRKTSITIGVPMTKRRTAKKRKTNGEAKEVADA